MHVLTDVKKILLAVYIKFDAGWLSLLNKNYTREKTISQNNMGATGRAKISSNVRGGHSEPMASLQLWALVGAASSGSAPDWSNYSNAAAQASSKLPSQPPA